jgi:hypothetical protein
VGIGASEALWERGGSGFGWGAVEAGLGAVEAGLGAVEAGLGAIAAVEMEMDGECRELMLVNGEGKQMFEFRVVR